MRTPVLLRSSLLVAVLGAALSAHALVFGDDFSLDQSAAATNTGVNTFGSMPTDPFGGVGTRVLTTYNFENEAPGDARSRASVRNGAFTYSSDEEVLGLGYSVYFFNAPTDFTGLHDVDVEFLSNDLPGIVSTKIQDSLGHEANTLVNVPAISSSTVITLTNVFAGLDATKITAFYLIVGNTRAEDVRLGGFVTTAPEPGTWAALGLGAVAMIRRRKRV